MIGSRRAAGATTRPDRDEPPARARAPHPHPPRPARQASQARAGATLALAALGLASACAPARGQDGPPPAGPPAADAVEIEPVRVIGQRPPRDPFAFDNPVEVDGTVFSRDWDEPPSPEEAGMRGGYVDMAIRWGLQKAAEGLRKVPGYTNQVVPAEARPPPLADDQAARALRLYQGAGGAAGSPDAPAAAAAGAPDADAAAADP